MLKYKDSIFANFIKKIHKSQELYNIIILSSERESPPPPQQQQQYKSFPIKVDCTR